MRAHCQGQQTWNSVRRFLERDEFVPVSRISVLSKLLWGKLVEKKNLNPVRKEGSRRNLGCRDKAVCHPRNGGNWCVYKRYCSIKGREVNKGVPWEDPWSTPVVTRQGWDLDETRELRVTGRSKGVIRKTGVTARCHKTSYQAVKTMETADGMGTTQYIYAC